jgi:hypothetical protein
MVAIATYSDLQSAVTEYLARDQDATLIARIPTFIQFAEAKFNRELFVRQMETRSTATVTSGTDDCEFILLPADFQSMRRIRLSGVTGKPTLEYKSPAGLDAYRLAIDNVTDQPAYFTIFGNEIELAPTPNATFTVEMVYRSNIPPLASNSSNWLLSMAPDLYLYGALLESAPYLKEDGRIQTWALGFSNALASLNKLDRTSSTFTAGPTVMRIAGPTP